MFWIACFSHLKHAPGKYNNMGRIFMKALRIAADLKSVSFFIFSSFAFMCLSSVLYTKKTAIHTILCGIKRPHNSIPYVCLIWETRNNVFTMGLHLVTERNWRWVLVSGLGQKNVHGPRDSWDITPTPWGWFQLLCMSKTNHYICF